MTASTRTGFWYDFLAREHVARCQSTFHGEYQSWEAHPIDEFYFSLDEPDDTVKIACDGA
jgi:hypothetical protein